MNIQHQHNASPTTRNSAHLPLAGADVLVAGLGGMGVVGLTQRIATLLRVRFQRVYTKESRGFAQRRASVTGTIRAGGGVRSPELVAGANLLLALEPSEAVRHEGLLRPGAQAVVCDTCVWPAGFSGRDFQPLGIAQVAARLGRRGVRMLSLPICQRLKELGLPECYASSAMVGAFAVLTDIDFGELEVLLWDSWKVQDREGNLAICRWAYGYVQSLLNLGQVA